ncbi:MAG TPA: DUF3754 domain-containing protein [Planctomycetota bacterium]|nr:DUF3754 domain-containing protein [Planctomycetota bacterium]
MSIWFEEAIPIHKEKFLRVLQTHISEQDRELFCHFTKVFDFYISNKFRKVSNKLSILYHPFNPDTTSQVQLTEEEEEDFAKILINKFRQFLGQAQYQEITEYDMQDILHQNHLKGVQSIFSPEKCRDFIIYFRNPFFQTRTKRTWKSLWLKKQTYNIPCYKRLAFLTRPFRQTLQRRHNKIMESDRSSLPQPIILKLFQNIPQEYLAIIFPGLYLKISWQKKLYVACHGLVASIASILSILSPWFTLLAVASLLSLFHAIYAWDKQKRHYYQDMLRHFYYNNVGNNHGVLVYLIDRIEEETYKQQLIVLYAFWQHKYWTESPITTINLTQYIHEFALKHFGVRINLNVENVLSELLVSEQKPHDTIPFIKSSKPYKHYLQILTEPGAMYMDLAPSSVPILNKGIVHIAPGTTLREKRTFTYNPYILYLEKGLSYSHANGASVRWLPTIPYQTKLAQEAYVDQNQFTIVLNNLEKIPLRGIAKIQDSEEFRYHRKPNSPILHLDTGLRYRHIPTEDNPVLVRPILPQFTTEEECTDKIPLPYDITFSEKGLVKIQYNQTTKIIPYTLVKNTLQLHDTESSNIPTNAIVRLIPPTTTIQKKIAARSVYLPVVSTKYFNKRGLLIIAPDTSTEERVIPQGETIELKLTSPLQFNHNINIIVQLKDTNLKTKTIAFAARKATKLILQAFSEDISHGQIILDPGENNQEICDFQVIKRYFELTTPTRYTHFPNEKVIEAKLESPLKYEAYQGNHIITVEDATHFPLKGKLEIHFNGTKGVKEVFPFVRTECSNTLLLQSKNKDHYPINTPIQIHAVDVPAQESFYNDTTIHVDFSCVPDFPIQGTIILEPGSQSEEIAQFQRHPHRIYFTKALEFLHSVGTVLDFQDYMQTEIKTPLTSLDEKLNIDIQTLLPSQGSLYIDSKEKIDILWYKKHPYRLILQAPVKYHHRKGESIYIAHLRSELALAENIAKGTQEIKLHNAQDLPKIGKIIIEGLFHTYTTQYKRTDNILYLQEPCPYHFSTHAYISIPSLYLNNHLRPDSTYIEINDISTIPEQGTLIFNAGTKKEERVPYKYTPDTLWFNPPIEKDYPVNTIIVSPELMASGSTSLNAFPLPTVLEQIQETISSIYIRDSNNIQDASAQNVLDITQNMFMAKI